MIFFIVHIKWHLLCQLANSLSRTNLNLFSKNLPFYKYSEGYKTLVMRFFSRFFSECDIFKYIFIYLFFSSLASVIFITNCFGTSFFDEITVPVLWSIIHSFPKLFFREVDKHYIRSDFLPHFKFRQKSAKHVARKV